ncbi:MAG: dTDP-4-dehydrorhamnose reductase [Syntrophaceae bacterium]|jgi:dTDP-4-dehydrorhamnose reductase|nr:dTDP-4-dehydrorhamnose reductase [Syntrophaceae bacterium]
MKILILGHKGMLGSDLLLRLFAFHDVTGKDIEDFDIASQGACEEVIAETEPDIVINAAAYTNVDGCESDSDACFSVNAEGVKNIALACRQKRIKIVHFSTDYVFDGTRKTPYQEDDKCTPLNVYGKSKLAGEQYLKQFSDNFLLIRSAWLYGKNGKNFVKTIIEKARTEKLLKIVDDQVGAPTFTWDLAAAVQLLIEGQHTGIFHITNRGNCSWYEFAVKILKSACIPEVTVKPIKSDELERPARRPHYSVLTCRKFSETTGKVMRYWQVALDDYISKMGY